jgi:dTDP-4-amino-4,6-dideoxygalactose transaminase
LEWILKVRLSKCSISSTEINAVKKILKAENLGMGLQVLEFEQAIKKYLETTMEVVCVNTGTSALQLALSALDIGYGDEVLVPSLTYIGSFQAISATGATPIACEVNADTLFIDTEDAKHKITSKTKAIMPVHYASSSIGMEKVYKLAGQYNLRVIEDAAQAFGCNRNNEKIGVTGDVICFSFDGIKNITSGEGGAILTNDKSTILRLRDDRLLGVQKDSDNRYSGKRSWEFDVQNQGFRFHMSNINAAIGIEQLKRINKFTQKRQEIVQYYLNAIKPLSELTALSLDYHEIVSHIFVIKAVNRDGLRQHLLDNDIECGIHYKPNHALTRYKTNAKLPITNKIYQKILTLPCHVDLSLEEQSYVVDKIKDFYNNLLQ